MSAAPSAPPARSASRLRRRLAWLAPALLAAVVVCSGCFMIFAFGLTARGELETTVLGSDWRAWQLIERGTNGVGLSQSSPFTSESGQACRATRIWLIIWRPALKIEHVDDVSCEARVAPALRSAIIAPVGGERWL